jgi:hypothetical protein
MRFFGEAVKKGALQCTIFHLLELVLPMVLQALYWVKVAHPMGASFEHEA